MPNVLGEISLPQWRVENVGEIIEPMLRPVNVVKINEKAKMDLTHSVQHASSILHVV